MHNNRDILRTNLPQVLVDKAKSCDRLRFAARVVPWKFEDACGECAKDWKGLTFCQERMAEAVRAIEFSLGVAQIEFQSAFINHFKDEICGIAIKPDQYHNPTLSSPQWIIEYFEEIFDNQRFGCFFEEIQEAQQKGARFAYWEAGIDLGKTTYTMIDIPNSLSDSVIEVFWGIVNDFAAPSYLTSITETSWLIRHVEE